MCSGKMFEFKLYVTKELPDGGEVYTAVVDSIGITDKTSGKLIQTIVCEENVYDCGPSDAPNFYIEDMNFDGIEDIRLMEYMPNGPNVPYFFWFYSKELKRFMQSNSMEDITNPVFDQKNKCVVSLWRASASLHGTSTYKYFNGILEIVEETDEEYNDFEGTTYIITKKRVEGQLEVVSRKEKKSEE